MTPAIRPIIVALLLIGGAQTTRAQTPTSDRDFEAVRGLILSSRGQEAAPDLLATRLAELGPVAIPPMLTMLADPGRMELREGERKVVLDALRETDAEMVLLQLRSLIDNEPSLTFKLGALRILGVLEGHDATSTALALLASLSAEDIRSPVVAGTVRRTLGPLLISDPQAPSALVSAWSTLERGTKSLLLASLNDTSSRRGNVLLAAILRRARTSSREVLAIFAQSPPARLRDLGPMDRGLIRRLLESRDPSVRSNAALVIQKLHDVEAFEVLIGLLSDREPRVRQAAERALAGMSGLRPRGSVDRWIRWWEGEQDWQRSQIADALESLESTDTRVVVTSLRFLTRHKLYRSNFAGAITKLLTHRTKRVRLQACRTLSQLQAPRAVAPLIEQGLKDEDTEVRRAAHDALIETTGLKANADRASWEHALSR